MRYAGWREHEYAVDSRDDVSINPDLGPSFAPIHAPVAPNRPSAAPAVPKPSSASPAKPTACKDPQAE